MAMISLTDQNWSEVTLTQDEIWQCRKGEVLVSTDPGAVGEDGIVLIQTQVRLFTNGQTIRYRGLVGNADHPAQIWREPK